MGAKETASEEEAKQKEEFELLVEHLQSTDEEVARTALQSIAKELQTATSSMTSVPTPLKLLRPMFGVIAAHYDSMKGSALKTAFADVLSVLATTAPASELTGNRSMLWYRLQGSSSALSIWGHEYLRHLAGEIAAEYAERQKDDKPYDDLMNLVEEMVPFYMKHNAECDAVDILCEVERIEDVKQHVDENSYSRVVLYLLSMANYAASSEEFVKVMTVAYDILMAQKQYPDALRVAMKMNSTDLLSQVVTSCTDSLVKLQLALMCARQRIQITFTPENTKPATKVISKVKADLSGDSSSSSSSSDKMVVENDRLSQPNDKANTRKEEPEKGKEEAQKKKKDGDEEVAEEEMEEVELNDDEIQELCDELNRLASGEAYSQHYMLLAKELDVLEPKLPEDVYKVHLEERRGQLGAALDSAKQNLASTLVNAFVNAGFCKDKLMTVEVSDWLYKNKDHGMLSAAASIGVVLLWNVDEALSQIDKYQWSNDVNVRAGAMMAFGLVSSGVRSDCDPALALMADSLDSNDAMAKMGAVVGLGFAYGGTRREDLLEQLIPMIIDTTYTIECSAMAALSAGLIYVGSCNQEAAEAILQTMIERQTTKGALDGAIPRFFAVGLGLLFLGSRDSCEPTIGALEAIGHSLGSYCAVTVEGFAFAGSGDVLKVQRMMQICVEKKEPKDGEDEESAQMNQAVAVLNIPLIAMSEEIGSAMSLRNLDHLLQYADLPQRRAIPLALALHSVSNPKPAVVDTLSKLSHDGDADVALHAIISLGLVGAGTNNSRIAGLLRQLAAFYGKDANAMFMVRISQGLLYMGKGLLTINPTHSDRFLINSVALGSLLTVLHACIHLKSTILGRQHYLLYHLIPAMNPRMLLTVDQNLNHIQVPVRVGQAVDTIGQAGRPKKITGFQTHSTPVLLSFNDRAELATEEYIPVSSVMEGVVILKRNPSYEPTNTNQQVVAVAIVVILALRKRHLTCISSLFERQ